MDGRRTPARTEARRSPRDRSPCWMARRRRGAVEEVLMDRGRYLGREIAFDGHALQGHQQQRRGGIAASTPVAGFPAGTLRLVKIRTNREGQEAPSCGASRSPSIGAEMAAAAKGNHQPDGRDRADDPALFVHDRGLFVGRCHHYRQGVREQDIGGTIRRPL